jgi:hypothetical protein
VVGADVDPAGVGGKVIDPVRGTALPAPSARRRSATVSAPMRWPWRVSSAASVRAADRSGVEPEDEVALPVPRNGPAGGLGRWHPQRPSGA